MNLLQDGNSLSKRYSIRTISYQKEIRYFEVGIPKEVVEREARKQGLETLDFVNEFEMEALYNSVEGIHYRFVRKINK